MSTSRRTTTTITTKDPGTGAAAAHTIASARVSKKTRSTTPLSERIATRNNPGPDSFHNNKENTNLKTRSKPFVPPISKTVKDVKDGTEPRARWSTASAVKPRGRSASPSQFGRLNSGVNNDLPKTRVSRVSNERSVSVDRSARIRDRANKSNVVEKSEKSLVKKCEKNEKSDEIKAKNVKVVEKSEDSVMKVSESVKMFERFRSKSSVGLRTSNTNGAENEENVGRLSFGGSSAKVSKASSSSSVDGSSGVKYPSKLHGKLAFLEEKVKRIASDIKRTKEMLDLNNPDASKLMLSDIQETVAGIEKAMGDVVKKTSPVKEEIKEYSGLNNEELEARLLPHHKLLKNRTTLAKVSLTVVETKPDEKLLTDVVEKGESKVTISEHDSFDRMIGNADETLAADEALDEEFDDGEENKEAVMVFDVEFDDSGNDELNEVGNKTCTGGWFLSEGESALLAHDDGSCSFYDVVNSEVKSVYKPPAGLSPNIWRDCWIVRALGSDGCSGRYVVAASAGNSMDSGFCSWDFYTREIKSFHFENGLTHTRTALAPLSNNVLNRRHDLSNLTPENRQWWYKPCGPLIVATASNQKTVKVFDIRDGEHVMKWDVQSNVVGMENSSPLQWRNRGKVVLAETESVSLWDVGSLTPEAVLTVSSSGKKISALHVNNTDAELGGGVRQRTSSSEAEGNDGIFCTSDSINVLDFRHPSGIALRIPKLGNTVHSVFSRGDSIYLGCSGSSSAARKPTSSSQIQQFSLRRQKLFTTYTLPESNAHSHYKAITQVWGNSNLTMGVSGLGLFVFDALKDDGSRPVVSDYGNGQKVRETIGPDNLYSPSFDYLGSRALLISRDRPACWKYLS